MTSIKETVGFLGRVILIRVGGLISDEVAQKVQSLEKELADMSSELESALTAAEAFAERMEGFHALYLERTGLLAEVRGPRDAAEVGLTITKRAADRLADEVAVLVHRKAIDARSPAGDALLDYRDPPSTERADRLAKAEAELERVRGEAVRTRHNALREAAHMAFHDESVPAAFADRLHALANAALSSVPAPEAAPEMKEDKRCALCARPFFHPPGPGCTAPSYHSIDPKEEKTNG